MLFNSLEYPFFFLMVIFFHFTLPHSFRWLFLLISSYFFYMCWRVNYATLMLLSTVVDYFCALGIDRSKSISIRKLLLGISLSFNLGLLFTFKYYNFFIHEIHIFCQTYGIAIFLPDLQLLLPVGISFYTFQTMSYTIDVYTRRIPAESHFGYFALYISFFPQLVAGPIERASHLLPQFREKKVFDPAQTVEGLRRILWGMFKKVVIADHLAGYVNLVYATPDRYQGPQFWIATYFFAFQIYCDFSGYSDIAIGSARILGYDLMENFRHPYFARTIPEFWGRWHISLSTWFRDYLYVPLGGNRVAITRWYFNLMIVFLVSGLWHGANWTFLVWGFLHGAYQLITLRIKKYQLAAIQKKKSSLADSSPYWLTIFLVLLNFHLVCIAWIFFRAKTLSEAFYILTHLFSWTSGKESLALSFGNTNLALGILYIFFLLGIEGLQEFFRWDIDRFPLLLRWSIYYLLIFGILYLGVFDVHEFLYFQF
ncbi:MAG: MBOAT family O-acyltransferase [Planctomycetota bacterium]